MLTDGMPTLSAGAHLPGEGKACVMEYVALLAGEPWTDSPTCTHPVLAFTAQNVNDRLLDSERHRLVPLIGRLFGTPETGTNMGRRVLSVRLAAWCARQVLRDGDDVSRDAIEAAEAWAKCPCARHRESSLGARSRALCAYANAAAGAAYVTSVAPTFTAASVADAAVTASTDPVALLTALLDEYDRLTGRTEHRHVTDAELRELAAAI